jgi:hypothetical protein
VLLVFLVFSAEALFELGIGSFTNAEDITSSIHSTGIIFKDLVI